MYKYVCTQLPLPLNAEPNRFWYYDPPLLWDKAQRDVFQQIWLWPLVPIVLWLQYVKQHPGLVNQMIASSKYLTFVIIVDK